jgi:hypothetical protein
MHQALSLQGTDVTVDDLGTDGCARVVTRVPKARYPALAEGRRVTRERERERYRASGQGGLFGLNTIRTMTHMACSIGQG